MRYIFILLIFFSSCSVRKSNTERVFPYDAIEVRNSGGVTGVSTGFLIQKNAEIYLVYHQANKAYNQKFYRLSTVDSVYIIFQKLAESQILNKKYNKPGNLTYSILTRKDSLTNSVYWADGQDSISNYIEMYNLLRNFATGRK